MYLKLVSPFNEAFEKCLKVYNPLMEAGATSPSDFPKVRSACADIPGENRKFSEGLVKGKWPTEAQSSVSQLADEVRADQLAWQEIAKARVHDDLFDPKYPLTEDTETAGLVRAHLGLPAAEDIEE
ncbi:hypothetical protein ABZ154_09220 [Streptomyces sp. NPDC006261]|uniref:hypothetical protein n=1 Tax=Streptomyces sp. NPDC006261 TaxID=3156739 RepID=UPI0033AD55CC